MLPVLCRDHLCLSLCSWLGECSPESRAAHPYLCLTLIFILFNIL